MPQAILTGKSMPKIERIKASDDDAVIRKNAGDGQDIPFLWATTVTVVSGVSEVVIASGVEFGGHKVCNGHVVVAPLDQYFAAFEYYVDKNTATNVVKLVLGVTARITYYVDVYVYLGSSVDYDSTDKIQIWKNP
jgi:hypothetical protein